MVIGLCGKAGSGKDSAFRYIEEWAKAKTIRIRREAFADRLKISAARAIWSLGELDAEAALGLAECLKRDGIITVEVAGETWTLTGREYYQQFGDEGHREVFGHDFWIKPVFEKYTSGEILVITDVRYPNEAKAVHDHHGELWQITSDRPLIAEDDHRSEDPLPPELIDYTIFNGPSQYAFRAQLIEQMQRVIS